MLAAAAVLPHPPLLVPEAAGAAAAELEGLRADCDEAAAAVLAVGPDAVVVVGGARGWSEHPAGARGSLRRLGVPVDVTLGVVADAGRPPGPGLPLSLTIGAWLLARTGWTGPLAAVALPEAAATPDAAATGRALAVRAPRVGLLVMGDGSARMSEVGPGYVDERAEPFQAAVAAALAAADTEALLGIDPALAAELQVAGRAAWQVLCGAADHAREHGRSVRPRLVGRQAPYGVDYLVATWLVGEAG